jgi:hypothetical protein
MNRVISIAILLLLASISFSQDIRIPVQINNTDKQFKLVGQFGEIFGTTFTVKGIIVDGPDKGYEPNLIVQMINDSSTQHPVQIPVSPYFGKFGEKPLPKLENGATYLLRAYETGEFVGIPSGAYKEAGIILQTSGFFFRNRLIIISGKKIEPIEWSPINFLEQNALLSGIAKNEMDTAVIQTPKWKLQLVGYKTWTSDEIGKLAEVYGKIHATDTKRTYNVENCQARLVNLKDQIGKTVKLRGIAQSLNGHWWFNYHGQDIYVENMAQLPGWTEENHFRPMEISGTLDQAELPRIDQITLKENPDRRLYYIVRKASWIPIQELLTPELATQK